MEELFRRRILDFSAKLDIGESAFTFGVSSYQFYQFFFSECQTKSKHALLSRDIFNFEGAEHVHCSADTARCGTMSSISPTYDISNILF